MPTTLWKRAAKLKLPLNQDERLDAWGKMLFFLREKDSLGGQRPLDMLREGRLKKVCLAAQAYAE